jgi:hypothetical protein
MKRNEIIDAYLFLRRHNHDIPDETLDFMKDSALKAFDSMQPIADKGENIKSSHWHDAGAYGRCSYCFRYSDDINCLDDDYKCNCGKSNGFTGSFKKPTKESKWHIASCKRA